MFEFLFESRTARLLVSVRNVDEASAAIEGGAEILDVKEPLHGPLGLADPEVLSAIVAEAQRRQFAFVTAALGELSNWDAMPPLPNLGCLTGLTMSKVGLAGEGRNGDWRERFDRLAASLSSYATLIAVAYADALRAESPSVADVVEFAGERGLPFVLIDTWRKDGQGLLRWLTPVQLAEIQAVCVERGVGLALAGSLEQDDILRLRLVRPNVFAVRGAACVGGVRGGRICADRVRSLREATSALVALGNSPL